MGPMAHANFDGLTLRLTLTAMERCAVGRGDLRLGRHHLVAVEHRADAWELMPPGAEVLGVGYPGMVALGAVHGRGTPTFCLVHGHDPGLAVSLQDHEFARIIFSVGRREAWPLFVQLRDATVSTTSPS
jgi:hypothetical protein